MGIGLLLIAAIGLLGPGVSPALSADSESAPPVTETKAPEPAPAKPLFGDVLPFPIGEKLIYGGSVITAGMRVHAGDATFTVAQRNGVTILETRALGEKFGYSLDTTMRSHIPKGAPGPQLFEFDQRGSELRQKKLLFNESGAKYMKVKHCKEPGCRLKKHQVKKVNWVGPIPWGTKKAHCTKDKCRKRSHSHWKQRGSHEFDRPYMDLLTAVYYARSLDLDKVGSSEIVPVVNDRDRWLVEVKVKGSEEITVEAGTFDAVELFLEPKATEGEIKKEFEGLFGLNGAIRVWIDRKSRRPVLIKGKIPFAFANFDCVVELKEVGSTKPPRATSQ